MQKSTDAKGSPANTHAAENKARSIQDSLALKKDTLPPNINRDSLQKAQAKRDSLNKKYGIASFPEAYYLERVPARDTSATAMPVECSKSACAVWADIHKSNQMLYLYLGGQLVDSFKVSTGMKGHSTPNLDTRPSGPIYNKYTSRKFPGGNYKGLGNMPYAVFIRGGVAIHGTTTGNFRRLGNVASHGCIRMHPDNGKIFNAIVRKAGLENVWITVGD